MKTILSILLILVSLVVQAQKKVLDHADFDIWNTIQNKTLSSDGSYIMYSLEKGEKDNTLIIKDNKAIPIFSHQRGENGQFSEDAHYAFFTIKAWQDTVREMKRRKVKKEDLPKDTLGIYSLQKKALTAIANVKSYKIPEKWSGYVAYQLEELKKKKEGAANGKSAKKEEKDKPYDLVVRNLQTQAQDTFKYVVDYHFAKEGKRITFFTKSSGDLKDASVYVLNLDNNQLHKIFTAPKATYNQLTISEKGEHVGFIADLDTTKALVRHNTLYHWQQGMTQAENLADQNKVPNGYRVSADGPIQFSKDETKLFFGLATPAVIKDTTLLDEEIVNVEVWTYDEPRLYTVQELQEDADRKKSFLSMVNLTATNHLVQLATTSYPNAIIGNEGNANFVLLSNPKPYQRQSQWEGGQINDYALVNTQTGETKNILHGIRGRVHLSPAGKYVFGYDEIDSTWFTYDIAGAALTKLTKGLPFFDERNDSPDYPSAYGVAGWTEDDASLLLYDRYDIWEFKPTQPTGKKLTSGRDEETVYRYVKLVEDERFMPSGKWLLTTFNESNKQGGYFELNSKNGKGNQLVSGPYKYGQPIKAKKSNNLIFTRESFQEFPDVRFTDLSFKTQVKISDANPQQQAYNWGTAELVTWNSLDGIPLQGMLIKPENFDPKKKYPMLVNFYERSSDELYDHKVPSPGRSTINYSFYTSRGYLIFNPDIIYKIGYPGESAYNCVMPGITSLIQKGFVDKENIGAQGHSWGGYQIAYLVTRTNLFKAAEAGAPVPNMISAYGGIRWWTGLSRQFQYEHTQSRIGGSPWEYPLRYIENSPIFFIDKINTPLLVMSNDADGHVPWYQGIEFFTALRRLGKPAWLLNYNGEPHWPLKLQNRKDFNIRMAQFFDYYLKGAPKPVWMERGVPALEKGINQGLELIDK